MAMSEATLDREELARKGQQYYNERLRDALEPEHEGEYVVLDVATGDYAIDRDQLAAMRTARAMHPGAVFYIIRVGYPTVGRIGARPRRRSS
jgi:hypothetical protein